jgi:L-fuconolactonase
MSKLKEGRDEAILDPGIAIIDTQHHLFDRPNLRYLFEDYLEDVYAGHKVVASVYVETQAMARNRAVRNGSGPLGKSSSRTAWRR